MGSDMSILVVLALGFVVVVLAILVVGRIVVDQISQDLHQPKKSWMTVFQNAGLSQGTIEAESWLMECGPANLSITDQIKAVLARIDPRPENHHGPAWYDWVSVEIMTVEEPDGTIHDTWYVRVVRLLTSRRSAPRTFEAAVASPNGDGDHDAVLVGTTADISDSLC